jgi:hypothetical protein
MTEILLVAFLCLVELQKGTAEGKTVEENRPKPKACFSADKMKIKLRYADNNADA